VVQECVSRFSSLAAGRVSAARSRCLSSSHTPTSLLKSRVWGSRCRPSGRFLRRARRGHGIAMGCRACGYKPVPGRQRWLNRDPIGIEGGVNLYAFTGNAPVQEIDPLGLALAPGAGVSNYSPPPPPSGLAGCISRCLSANGAGVALGALGVSSLTVGTLPKPFGAGALGGGSVTTGFSVIQHYTGIPLRAVGRYLNPIGDIVSVAAAGYLVGSSISCSAMCASNVNAF
jgi:RHS repeat-associated protein